MILSTPNKLYASPFLPNTVNPYHVKEYYLGQLLTLIESEGFKVGCILGGRKETILKLIRKILYSYRRFFIGKFCSRLSDRQFFQLIIRYFNRKKQKKETLLDPDPKLFPHVKVKASFNIILYAYFVIYAYKP